MQEMGKFRCRKERMNLSNKVKIEKNLGEGCKS